MEIPFGPCGPAGRRRSVGSYVSQSDEMLEVEWQIWEWARQATEASSDSKICENDDWGLNKCYFLLFYFQTNPAKDIHQLRLCGHVRGHGPKFWSQQSLGVRNL